MTIIFLDFDGVLHPEDLGVEEEHRLFECAPHLWSLLRAAPECQVVFSTSWRHHHALPELIQFATTGGGEDLASRFIGVTSTIETVNPFGDYGHREKECLDWRNKNGHGGPWIAIDDVHAWFSFGSTNAYQS